MADDFEFNPKFFDWLGQDPAVKQETKAAAERVAAKAKGTAPVDTGHYQESIKVVESPVAGRVTYRVVADCDHGLAVEARTGNLARSVK